MTLEEKVDAAICAAFPANSNHPRPLTNVRLVPDRRVDELVSQLERFRPVGRTWERPQRLVLNPAPWVRRMLSQG
jgi:hypothetical protein